LTLQPPHSGLLPDLLARIAADIAICGGRPCIKGTRVRVSDLLDLISHGATCDEILSDYPYLVEQDLLAALAFAAQSLGEQPIED
jgi:uncharacterized protein (DUF433 family)